MPKSTNSNYRKYRRQSYNYSSDSESDKSERPPLLGASIKEEISSLKVENARLRGEKELYQDKSNKHLEFIKEIQKLLNNHD